MKKFLALIAVLLVTGMAPAQSSGPQSWTNIDGKVVFAEFVRLDGETLLVRALGTEFPLPLAKLSPESREQAKRLAGISDAAPASKEQPFENSLGMKFVPVAIKGGPTDGKKVMFSVWETRVSDYAAYAAANPGIDMKWKDAEFKGHKQTGDHPVVNMSYELAVKFCEWLGKKEGKTYRLPTDHEWSCAVGLGEREDPGATPQVKDGKINDEFPWGKSWPPPAGAGNVAGKETEPLGIFMIEGYQDRHVFTAPVGSYDANGQGLHDMGGNVREWTSSDYDGFGNYRVLRGGSWNYSNHDDLLSSDRNNSTPDFRNINFGFRVVCE